jgi:hypothetical protein
MLGGMDANLDESLLRDLAQPLVAEFSPAEQGELFPLLSEAHFAHPEAFASKDKGGGPLAFGLPELTLLLTPVMLAVMNEVIRYIVDRALPKGTKITSNAIRRLFGRGRDVEPAGDAALALTAEQWAEVRRIVERVAVKGGVGAEQAQHIAEAVAGQGRTGRELP